MQYMKPPSPGVIRNFKGDFKNTSTLQLGLKNNTMNYLIADQSTKPLI